MSFASAAIFASDTFAVTSSSVLFFKTTTVVNPPALAEYAFVPSPFTVLVASPCFSKLFRPTAKSDALSSVSKRTRSPELLLN